jgi:plasmid stability protein
MATLRIRNVEEWVIEALQNRAEKHGWSLEDEVREILTAAVRDDLPGLKAPHRNSERGTRD